MNNLSTRLFETISKDIEELESNTDAKGKLLRKECSLIRARIESLKKLNLANINKVEAYEKRLDLLMKRN